MQDMHAVTRDTNSPLDRLAADLTAAAYSTALQHGVGKRWLDLEPDLWRTMTETVNQWRQSPRAG